MTALFVFPPYLFKSVFPSSFISWSACFHVPPCASCVCCFCFFCHPGVYFIALLLVACLFTVCLSIFIRFTDCLFNLPKRKNNVKFHLRNQAPVFAIDYLLLFKSHSVFFKDVYGESAKRKRDKNGVIICNQFPGKLNNSFSLSFLPCINIKTELCYWVESVTVKIWWENKKKIFFLGMEAQL